jgi:hypothetical protein
MQTYRGLKEFIFIIGPKTYLYEQEGKRVRQIRKV